jgi:septal ring factor EnvC (AmiA/AmiB activator)
VRLWATRLVILVLAVGGGYLVYEFGRIQAGYDLVDAASERRQYKERIGALEDEISALKEQIALLETHREIDREAYREVEASLTELQAKIQEQRDAIAFYRGIVSPADGNKGLRVQDLRLTRGKNEREYNIRLVLVQALKHDRKVSGNVNLSIEGDLDGVEKTYSYAELLPEEGQAAWAFSFRYFQDFNRQVVLPDGFTPQRVKVEVESRTRSIDSIEESFAWTTSQG